MSLPLKLISGSSHRALAEDLAGGLNVALEVADIGAFADGEIRVHIEADVRGAVVVIVQPRARPSTNT